MDGHNDDNDDDDSGANSKNNTHSCFRIHKIMVILYVRHVQILYNVHIDFSLRNIFGTLQLTTTTAKAQKMHFGRKTMPISFAENETSNNEKKSTTINT